MIDLTKRELPSGIGANSDIIFPIIHGEFGEDGELQALWTLKVSNTVEVVRMQVVYVCTNLRPKKRVSGNGVRVPGGIEFHNPSELITSEIISGLSNDLIIKPTDQEAVCHCFWYPEKMNLLKP